MSSEARPGRIHAAVEQHLGRVVIDHPAKHNALTFDMWQSLPGLLDELESRDDVRAIVFEGAGDRAFASGSDISQFGEQRDTEENVRRYNATVERAIGRIGAVRKPTLAFINGYCFGGGVAIALHCDMRYANEQAQFCIPAGKVGSATTSSGCTGWRNWWDRPTPRRSCSPRAATQLRKLGRWASSTVSRRARKRWTSRAPSPVWRR